MNKVFMLLVFIFSQWSFAAVELNEGKTDYSEIARSRSYPGGVDEEDLKVKESVEEPTESIYRSTIDKKVLEELKKKKAAEADSDQKTETQ